MAKKQSKGKAAAKKAGRALKGAASSVLGAGAKILGAGSEALANPKKRKTAKKRKTVKRKTKRNAARTVSPVRKTSTVVRRASKRKAAKRRSVVKARKGAVKTVARKTTKKIARSLKRARKNPSAESIRKKFAGQINGEKDLFFPQGTPNGKLAKLGKLVLIETEKGTIKPVAGTAWLCADERERLHIGSTSPNPLFGGAARSFGKVKKVEYESSKPHLGYKGPIIWFHHMGERGGTKPTLHADGKGGLVFKGGNYTLTERGIEH